MELAEQKACAELSKLDAVGAGRKGAELIPKPQGPEYLHCIGAKLKSTAGRA